MKNKIRIIFDNNTNGEVCNYVDILTNKDWVDIGKLLVSKYNSDDKAEHLVLAGIADFNFENIKVDVISKADWKILADNDKDINVFMWSTFNKFWTIRREIISGYRGWKMVSNEISEFEVN